VISQSALARNRSYSAREADPVTAQARLDDRTLLVRGEYLRIPGLHLTRSQVQCWWDLDADTCDKLLDALVETQFLERTCADGFVRVDDRRR
jgi:hypothetical protein